MLSSIIFAFPDRIKKLHQAQADHRQLILNVIYHRERTQAFKKTRVIANTDIPNNCLQTTMLALAQLDKGPKNANNAYINLR